MMLRFWRKRCRSNVGLDAVVFGVLHNYGLLCNLSSYYMHCGLFCGITVIVFECYMSLFTPCRLTCQNNVCPK